MPQVAVVYLARIAHGIDAFKPFAESYKKFPAGYPHELILLGKGVKKRGEHAAISALFDEVPHRIIEGSEDGYDIHAYLKAAKILDHDYVFFCNTYTELTSESWLGKMMNLALQPNVGIVGTSASYESLFDSNRMYEKVLWLTNTKKIKYNAPIAEQYGFFLDINDARWMAAYHSHLNRVRRMVGDWLKKRPKYLPAFDAEHEMFWHQITNPGAPMAVLRQFPRFPNPHIRSTGFLISRKRLLSFGFEIPETKMDCALFESGSDGLSRKLVKQGLDLILAGADGRGYTIEEWPKSRTFRLDDQANCITRDNHISAYATFNPKKKELHDRITWGDYLGPATSGFQSLKLEFHKVPNLENPAALVRTVMPENDPIQYSIVIPTHDRLALVKDAIETVRRQTYANWELVVFDNASSEPLAEHVNSIGDSRIRLKRSEQFLPVTESWNRGIDEATGDYVMLIGDDDGLTPSCFERLNELNYVFHRPDVIYSSILQFFHPGVAPWKREGYVSDVRNGFFFLGRDEAFILDDEVRRTAVEGSLNIRRNFTFNMQAFVFKREFIHKIKMNGKVFHSLFPDYYLANAAFALADKIVADPDPLAIAGVSRASFGFTLFNNLEDKGAALLNSDLDGDLAYQAMKDDLLPGPAYNTNYILTMEHVRRRIGDWTAERPNVDRYRKMQLLWHISQAARGIGWLKTEMGSVIWKKLSVSEKIWVLALSLSRRSKDEKTFFQKVSNDLCPTGFSALVIERNVGDFVTTMQLFNALERGELDTKHENQMTERRLPTASLRSASIVNIAME